MRRMMGMKVVGGAAAIVLLGVAFVSAGPGAAVNWRSLRAVALESDDWGLAGFVPSTAAWDGLRREDLSPGRFPEVYWNSTLEDSAAVADLGAILAGARGRDGLPAVLQPNYVLSSLAFEAGQWRRYDLPELPAAYQRPGLWPAVQAAIAAGVWHPEFHAAWHYDPERRREAVGAGGAAREAAERGIMLFPGSEAARELGPWRPTEGLAAELDQALEVFAAAFGRPPGALIAPDYTWDGRCEDLWESRGLRVIQAKREQRHPGLPQGMPGRVLKVLERQWSRARNPGRAYLERNCRLEPVQAPDPAVVADACAQETMAAWRRGEPAIVETHRVNFAHGQPEVARAGRQALARYLAAVAGPGSPGPLFMVDAEIAGLMRRGTSARWSGDRLVLRNGTRSRRVVEAPAGGGRDGNAAASRAGARTAVLYLLDPGFQGVR